MLCLDNLPCLRLGKFITGPLQLLIFGLNKQLRLKCMPLRLLPCLGRRQRLKWLVLLLLQLLDPHLLMQNSIDAS